MTDYPHSADYPSPQLRVEALEALLTHFLRKLGRKRKAPDFVH
ncbi:hypothetical protein [Hoeflea sp. TYP-13]